MTNKIRPENIVTFLWWNWWWGIRYVYLGSRSWSWCRRFLRAASWTSEESQCSRPSGHYEWLHSHPPFSDQECSLLSCAIILRVGKKHTQNGKTIQMYQKQDQPECYECVLPFRLIGEETVLCYIWYTTSGLPHDLQRVVVQLSSDLQLEKWLHGADLFGHDVWRCGTSLQTGLHAIVPSEISLNTKDNQGNIKKVMYIDIASFLYLYARHLIITFELTFFCNIRNTVI